MLFDFQKYLHSLDPTCSYSIRPLTGGIVNVTVRATKGLPPAESFRSRFPEHESLILKYATPFIAAVGPSAPFDTYRQVFVPPFLLFRVASLHSDLCSFLYMYGDPTLTLIIKIIEARALSLFVSSSSLLHSICKDSTVLVPNLLYHDSEHKVLVISDLGNLDNLSDHFKGFLTRFENQTDGIADKEATTLIDPATVSLFYRSIGRRLGHFFGLLHSPRISRHLKSSSTYQADYLSNPDMMPFVFSEAIKPLEAHLSKFPDLVSAEEVALLYRRIEENFNRKNEPDEESLVVGDCWTGTILIEGPHLSSVTPNADAALQSQDRFISERLPKVGVIDWEFASIGRGLDGDVSQLLAHLQQFIMFAEHRGNVELIAAVRALMEGLVQSYRETSIIEEASWTAGPVEGRILDEGIVIVGSEEYEENSMARKLSRKRAKILRSFMLSHAAEIINCAFWKEWDCGPRCCNRPSSSEHGMSPREWTGDATLRSPTIAEAESPPVKIVKEDFSAKDKTPFPPVLNTAVPSSHNPDSPRTPTKSTDFKKEDCKLIRLYMAYAIKHLRRAGNDVEEFMRSENLGAIEDERLGWGDGILLDLLVGKR